MRGWNPSPSTLLTKLAPHCAEARSEAVKLWAPLWQRRNTFLRELSRTQTAPVWHWGFLQVRSRKLSQPWAHTCVLSTLCAGVFQVFPSFQGCWQQENPEPGSAVPPLQDVLLPCRIFSSPLPVLGKHKFTGAKKPPWGQTSESSQPCPWQGISIYWNICELKPTPPFRFPFLKGCPGFAGDDKYRCICKNTV